MMGYCNVTISVSRNPSAPVIIGPADRRILVPNTKLEKSVIVNVDAQDPDGVSASFFLFFFFWSFLFRQLY